MACIQLPPDMTKGNTCFFTGHRFIAEEDRLYPHLVRSILRIHGEGYRYFISGGALGFDLLSAQTVALLRNQYHKDIRLVLALPCRDQTSRWDSAKEKGLEALKVYHNMKNQADAVVYLYDFYTGSCMRDRNRFMVDHASRCIAYWNGKAKGGTAQTVGMARKTGIPVRNLYPALDHGTAEEI